MKRNRIGLEQVQSYIQSRLMDPDFELEELRHAFGVSESFLRSLFRSSGETPSSYVTCQRLALAAQMLVDPKRRHHTILTIAVECGFREVSNFNRRFRLRFGVAPSLLRNPDQLAGMALASGKTSSAPIQSRALLSR